ncbi:hypothetical protein, partial [Burkholderia pyrrocinia]|uniref:hypothetical protein n=1 Tax=Burkholderia pyrrocinia TaxID=60550 RepID=UPI001ABB3B3A
CTTGFINLIPITSDGNQIAYIALSRTDGTCRALTLHAVVDDDHRDQRDADRLDDSLHVHVSLPECVTPRQSGTQDGSEQKKRFIAEFRGTRRGS